MIAFVTKGTIPVQSNGVRPIFEEEIGYKLWDSNDFQGLSNDNIQTIANSKTYCPKIKDYYVSGNYASDNYAFVGIHLKTWSLQSGWKSPTEVQDYINNYVPVLTLIVIYK